MDCAWRPRTKVKSDRLNIDSAGSGGHGLWRAAVLSAVVGPGLALLSGCVAQQADLKQTERELQRRIKQSTEEQAQNSGPTESGDRIIARARHSFLARRRR